MDDLEEEEEEEEKEQRRAARPAPAPSLPEEPVQQKLIKLKAYRFRPSKNAWKHVVTNVHRDDEHAVDEKKGPCSQLRIISWNIDFDSPHKEERLTAALRHIEEDVLQCKEDEPPEPCCILLQEVNQSVMPSLLRDEWVRRWFVVTPYTKDKWPEDAGYGNVTLISRSLNLVESHILHYGYSVMSRTALCVKIKLNVPGTQEKRVISIVNTHLESLPQGTPFRPKQLEMCARFLRLNGVYGGVIAGDMNSIAPGDAEIGKRLGLKDSWRKGDDSDAGKTWGFQGQNQGNYPTARLDKVFYLPGMGYRVDQPKCIGVGLKILESSDEALWVSDHYGLDTTLRMLKPRSNSS
ncbi:hypothetical protein JR316_0005898 [Psilocybe cubensis]|uniref:Endonuclease/exonuclease/phosphatase domain-containing protein n=2 Tax=Psilocybe cubensis TaxID=181762 RepID=A0A8H8CM32_PSICU|nr:hypothetical protein JR316_0005898 [Psilocybe cubensis]KAH9481373.1 hypothetical protein JR316_0005898 [Psilocybe cubensis]